MYRRTFLKSAIPAAITVSAVSSLSAPSAHMPVIDSHIHLFDPTRPGGVPWPAEDDRTLYKPALPSRYAQIAKGHGVVGAIAIECSPWVVDNFWLQDVLERNPIVVGYIGDLEPADESFAATLDRLHRSPLFLGIRYGNLWKRNLGSALQNASFVAGLKLLAQTGCVLETANPDADLIAAIRKVVETAPDLRLVIDHLPNATLPADPKTRSEYDRNLQVLAQCPTVFVKGSEIVRRMNGGIPLDMGSYRAGLDQMWDLFGENRIFFGSDWPNSDTVAPFDQVFQVADRYIKTRSVATQTKYFWQNSRVVYRWSDRTPEQRSLGRG